MSLEHLKVGDQVFSRPRFGNGYSVTTIKGETKTRWKLSEYTKIRKSDGKVVGASALDTQYYYEITPAVKEQIKAWQTEKRKKEILYRIGQLTTTPVSVLRLQAIYAELTQDNAEEEK